MKFMILLLLIVVPELAECSPACSVKGTNVIYTNGVNTQEREAWETLKRLRTLNISTSLDQYPENGDFILKYNYHYGFAADFLESAVQRFPSGFLAAVGVTNPYAAYMFFKTTSLMAQFGNDLASIIQASIDLHRNFMDKYKVEARYQNDLQKIRASYEDSLNDGYRVLAISHSQGGLFMEDAYDLIEYSRKNKHFSGIQVATPVLSSIIPKQNYVTHDKDLLIMGLYYLVGTLPANFEAPMIVHNEYTNTKDYLLDFVLNHGMYSTYLYEPSIKTFVQQKIIDSALLLESNCPIAKFTVAIQDKTVSLDSLDTDDPLANRSIYKYIWDFGDGTTETTTSKTISHTYLNTGTYTISLRVTDDEEREFGELSRTQKAIIVGADNSRCSGEKGKFHINPDGSPGGFVSDTATVANTVKISQAVDVCGSSQLLGSTIIDVSYSYKPVHIQNSNIIDSHLSGWDIQILNSSISSFKNLGQGSLYISNSTVNNLSTGATPNNYMSIADSTLLDTLLEVEELGGSTIIYRTYLKDCSFKSLQGPWIGDVNLTGKSLDMIWYEFQVGYITYQKRDGTRGYDRIESYFYWNP